MIWDMNIKKLLYMKFGYLVSVFMLSGMVLSCAKQLNTPDPDLPTGDSDLVKVDFTIANGENTKVIGITDANETRLNRYAVFAFDVESGWFAYKVSTSGESVQLQLRSDRTYHCYALTNYPASGSASLNPAGISRESDLTGKIAYLADNSVSSLMMYGMENVTVAPMDFDPLTDPSAITPVSKTIHVKRIVSRIDVTQVAVDFTGKPYFDGKTFVLKGIYMTNLYKSTRFASDYSFAELSNTRSMWYNGGGWHRGGVAESGIDALVGNTELNVTLTKSAPYTVSNSFYVLPNATPKVSDEHQMDTWSKRCTRIIIEAALDGETMYYQVDVPAMERNIIYRVNNIVITGRGSNDPEIIDITPMDEVISFSIEASDWDTPINVNENS